MGEAVQAGDPKHRSSSSRSYSSGPVSATQRPRGHPHTFWKGSQQHPPPPTHSKAVKESCKLGYIAPVSYSSLSSTRFSWGKEANAVRRPHLTQPPAAPFRSPWRCSPPGTSWPCTGRLNHPRNCLAVSSKPLLQAEPLRGLVNPHTRQGRLQASSRLLYLEVLHLPSAGNKEKDKI